MEERNNIQEGWDKETETKEWKTKENFSFDFRGKIV